jgi:hypothetical protein
MALHARTNRMELGVYDLMSDISNIYILNIDIKQTIHYSMSIKTRNDSAKNKSVTCTR